LSLSTKMAPLVDTRTIVTGCAASQLKVNGRTTSSVKSSWSSKVDKTVVPDSPAMGLNGEQPTPSGVQVGPAVGAAVGRAVGAVVGSGVGTADGAAVGVAVGVAVGAVEGTRVGVADGDAEGAAVGDGVVA
jgi:hypothetical protein